MTAHDILLLSSDPRSIPRNGARNAKVTADTPALALLPRLLDSPTASLEVTDGGGDTMGVVDAMAMLRGLDAMLDTAAESSWIDIDIPSADYSASAIARAVEDADANMLDMITSPHPSSQSLLRVTLRVSHTDPSAVVRSLRRYGFEVVSELPETAADLETTRERLSQLQLYLNI